ncbi:MAG: hypothetical protein EAZ55_09700 [Cytophagales bacterium]|nr:MAG: hypothetical protein EAZ55_09700 [Cytophagales bacterium]
MAELIWIIVGLVIVMLLFAPKAEEKTKTQNLKNKNTTTKSKKNEPNKSANKILQKASSETIAYKHYLKQFEESEKNKKLPPVYAMVAGTRYKNDDTGAERQEIIRRTQIGETLMLIPDVLNPYDKDAIKVVRLNGEQIGFIGRELAIELKPRLMNRLRIDTRVSNIISNTGIWEVEIELVKYGRK